MVLTDLCNGCRSTSARKRLIRDFKRLSADPPAGVSGAPCPDNLLSWNAVIFGPGKRESSKQRSLEPCEPQAGSCRGSAVDTPFEDGTFRLVLTFEEQYPNKPPQCVSDLSLCVCVCMWIRVKR